MTLAKPDDTKNEILAVLSKIVQQLFVTDNLEKLLPEILPLIGEAVRCERLYIFQNFVDGERNLYVNQRFDWVTYREGEPVQFGNPKWQNIFYKDQKLTRWVAELQQGKAVIGHLDQFPEDEQEVLRDLWRIQSIAIFPIFIRNEWWGFMGFDHVSAPRVWREDDIEGLRSLASVLGTAVENERLYEAESWRRHSAEKLGDLTTLLLQAPNIESILNKAINVLRDFLPQIGDCAIATLENSGVDLRSRGFWAEDPIIYESFFPTVRLEDTYIAQKVISSQQALIIDDVRAADMPQTVMESMDGHNIRSLMYVPLLAHEQPVGLLFMHVYHEVHNFTSSELDFCRSVADHAALAIQELRLRETEREQLRLTETLRQVGGLLTTSLSLDDALERIFDYLEEIISFDKASIMLFEKADSMEVIAGRGWDDNDVLQTLLRDLKPVILEKFREENSRVVADITQSPEWVAANVLNHPHSWAGALMTVKDEVIGILNVDSAIPNAYDIWTAEKVLAFANQAAVALVNARQIDEQRKRVQELEILHSVATATTLATSLDQMMHTAMQTMVGVLEHDSFGFLFLNEDSTKLIPHPSYYFRDDLLEFNLGYAPLYGSLCGQVVRTGQPIIVGNVLESETYLSGVPSTRSEMVVPLLVDGQSIGVLNIESERFHAFSKHDLKFMTTLANQIAIAVQRTRLYEQIEQYAMQLAAEVAQSNSELETQKEWNEAIIENAGEGIFFSSPSGKLLFTNSALAEQTGFRKDELIFEGDDFLSAQFESSVELQEMWDSILNGRRWRGELICKRKDGTTFDISLTLSPLHTSQSEISGFVGILSDITKLKEIDRLKSQFVRNVSHELRTPLTSIRTYIDLLERGKPEKHDRYLEVLRQESDRLTRLIQDLLDISRLDTGATVLQFEPIDLSFLIKQALRHLKHEYADHRYAINLNFAPDLPFVWADPKLLRQVILNLLSNAINFSKPNEAIEVTVTPARAGDAGEPAVRVAIVDQGPGIPLEEQPQLFDRFFRGEAAYERRLPGTGLGLALSHEIMVRHHTHITVDSQPGVGSTFSFVLRGVVPEA